jgi:hypothetical protein
MLRNRQQSWASPSFVEKKHADASPAHLYSVSSMSVGAFQFSPRFAAAILALPALALLSGCLVTSGRTVRETGPQISESALRAIEYNKTSTEWLIAAFGEPQNRVCLPDGAEVLRYDSDVRTTEGSYFFMLAASSANKIERTCWWFETRDGKVVRAWGEKCDPITVDSMSPPPPNDRAIGVSVPAATATSAAPSKPLKNAPNAPSSNPSSAASSNPSSNPSTSATPSGQ